MYYKDTSTSWKVIGILVVILIILRLLASCVGSVSFNNGICPKCGGHFKYMDAVGYRYSTSYLYRCDKCGYVIRSADLYNDKEYPIEYENEVDY